MQKTLKDLVARGLVERFRIIERGENGKAQMNTVYVKITHFEGDDGFGNVAGNCATCGNKLQVVRPGKFQCPRCD